MVARSGKEAVEVFQKNRDRIDLIILDMVMPDMSGKETYDRLKEIHSGIKVLLSSGYSLDSQAQEILDRGCEGFMQKPFGINELSRKLREILDDN
jgi:CheY-like chemotaxis protein